MCFFSTVNFGGLGNNDFIPFIDSALLKSLALKNKRYQSTNFFALFFRTVTLRQFFDRNNLVCLRFFSVYLLALYGIISFEECEYIGT